MSDESSIFKIVFLFHFIKDTGIIPQYLSSKLKGQRVSMHQLSKQISGKNRNIVMLILMTNLVYKLFLLIYQV